MTVYGFLSSKLPPFWAGLLSAFWYAVLLTLIVFASFENQAAFIYGDI